MTDKRRERVLRQHLQTERLLGLDAVPVRRRKPAAQGASPAAPASTTASAPASTHVRSSQPEPALPRAARATPSPAATPATPLSPSFAPDAAPAPGPALSGAALFATAAPGPGPAPIPRERKIELLAAMDEHEVKGCTKCPLCKGRTQTVFGEGDPQAAVFFVGEGPGQTEDETGRPFVGRAGELLEKMIVAMGLKREDVFIANVVKCRPPNNRAPTPIEVETCWDYLRRQVETVQPKVLVSLGGPATKKLADTDKGITSIRGTWHRCITSHDRPPLPLMPTFHPAYLLRSYTPENRRKVWSDLQKVMAYVKDGVMG